MSAASDEQQQRAIDFYRSERGLVGGDPPGLFGRFTRRRRWWRASRSLGPYLVAGAAVALGWDAATRGLGPGPPMAHDTSSKYRDRTGMDDLNCAPGPVPRAGASLLAAVVTAALLAAGCGGGTNTMAIGDLSAGGSVGDPAADAAAGGDSAGLNLKNTTGDLPDIDMIDVSTAATVNLQSLVDHETPLLFWFWAPH